MEQVFAQARDAEAASEEFLVDDGWKAVDAELESVVVEVHTNGANSLPSIGYGGNGHVVEPELVGRNGNGHHHEPTEGQQSLFSWAEFLAEEPAQPQGRNGKPKPPRPCPSSSAALHSEQEREKEPVGAGR